MRIILLLLLFIYFHSIITGQNISPIEKKADSLAKYQSYKSSNTLYNQVLKNVNNNQTDSVRIIIKEAKNYYHLKDLIRLKEKLVNLNLLKKIHPDIDNNTHWSSYIYFMNGIYYNEILEYDSAEKNINSAINIRIKNYTDTILADFITFKGIICSKKLEYNKSITYYKLAIKYYILNKLYDSNIVRILLNTANIYWQQNEKSKFKSVLDIAVKMIKMFKIEDKYIAKTYMNLGSYYLNQSDYFNAYKSFSKISKLKNVDNQTELQSKYYIAFTYKELGDFKLSNDFYKQVLSNQSQLSSIIITNSYCNLALNYYRTNSYDSSLIYTKKCLIINEKSKIINSKLLNFNLARIYYKLHYNDSALHCINIAINQSTNEGKNDANDAEILMQKGLIINDINSEFFFNQSIKIIKENCGKKHSRTAYLFLEKGFYNLMNKLYHKSLQDFQQALNSVDLDFNSTNVFENPECKNVLSAVNLAKALRYKSETLEQIYLQNDSLQYLEAAYETSKLLTTQVEKMLMSYPLFESKQFLLDNSANLFSRAQYLGYLCFKKTGKTRYKNENLEIAEKSRAAILNAQIQENEFAAQSLNDSLSQQLLEIEQNISYITSQINELSNLDNKLTNKLKNDLFELYEKKNKLIEGYKGEYGNFSNYFKKSKALTFNQLLNFPSDNEVVLEYTLCDSIILLNVVQRAKHEIFEIVFDSILKQKLEAFQKQIVFDYSKNYTTNCTEDINKLGNYLYNKLILPAEAYTSGKQIIIVQEPKLKFIPFDAFFVNNKYLIEQHAISYIFTINITTENNRNILSCNKQHVAAFFPSYDLDEKKLTLFSEKYYKTLGVLNNKAEAEQLSNIVECDTFMVQNATEENFKKLAGNYTILHLSLHSILNPENFLLSKLCFTPTNDSLNDGLFNICDVVPLKLNAQLTVLSGCNTGNGQQIASEGAMSFARSFILAGSRSILMSLWELNNNSAIAINTGFYKYLAKGYNKSEALQLSKIDYLKNAANFNKHPFFWSGFVLIGDNKCIVLPTHYTIIEKITFIIVTIMVILMVWFFLKKRKLIGYIIHKTR